MTILLIILIVLLLLCLVFILAVMVLPPRETETPAMNDAPVETSPHFKKYGNSWFRKSTSGLWELYIEGKPFERGIAIGKMTKDLMHWQEAVFYKEVSKMIRSKTYLFILKMLIALLNRRLAKFIGKEYCSEIHGVSLSAPKEFAFIGPAYQRYLNYHAAHDIGHTLQSFHLVGCTAFSVWGNRTPDGKILTGRNFDFYVGDDFSKEKILSFYRPEKGYCFAAVTWGGMIGCTSGMNEQGLCVMVNGAQAEFPNRSATPVSILVREVLQYASNISEAFDLIKNKRIFVAESLVISSAKDHKTVVAEKSKSCTALFETGTNQLVCTNHFQSPELCNDPSNLKYMAGSPSVYRYQRVEELLDALPLVTQQNMADILRNKYGHQGAEIGMGNEKAIDQLLAHHSIIFKPEDRIFWISCGPYPEGTYIAYDLKKIFEKNTVVNESTDICSSDLNIPEDPFLSTEENDKYITYKTLLTKFASRKMSEDGCDEMVKLFIESNPEMHTVYSTLGNYYYAKQEWTKAKGYYETGLQKQVPNLSEAEHMSKRLKIVTSKLNRLD